MKNAETLETPKINKEVADKEKFSSPIEESLSSLDKITRSLSLLSTGVLLATFLNLAASIYSLYIYALAVNERTLGDYRLEYIKSHVFYEIFPYIVVCWTTFLLVISALYSHELKRKHGEVLFEEISDELEWHINSDKETTASIRPKINARISLRSFVKTTDLPFVPGKFGPVFYLLLNLALAILSSLSLLRIV